jgi:phospholipase/carboxylesterase
MKPPEVAGFDGVSVLTHAARDREAVEAAVLWLHGLGADGHDFEPVVPLLSRCQALAVRFLFPHAPHRPVTLNGGLRMRAWYDIRSIDLAGERTLDRAGMQASVDQVDELLDAIMQAHALPARRLVLAGFSQGGVIALQAALARQQEPARALAGVVALSCYLPGGELPPASGLAVFQGHGTQDPMVPIALGEQAATRLRERGAEVDWHRYPVAHGVAPEELDAIDAWLAARLHG